MPINTQKQRQLQRERINRVKPWLKSTGPRSLAGKEKSKMNALKVDIELYYLIKEYEELMLQQSEILNMIEKDTVRVNVT